MKHPLNKYKVGTLTIMLVIIASSGCRDSIIEPSSSPSPPIHYLVGTWYQIPLNGNETMERTLKFIDGFGFLNYPDRTGQCGDEPELLKRFRWEEAPEKDQTLQITVYFHGECGLIRGQSYEESIHYSNKEDSVLHIFNHKWKRKQ